MKTSYDNVTATDRADVLDRLVVKARVQSEIRAWHMPEAELPADLLPVADPVFWWHEEGANDLLVPLEAEPADLGGGWWGYENGAAYRSHR
jgi:hypothetical protein